MKEMSGIPKHAKRNMSASLAETMSGIRFVNAMNSNTMNVIRDGLSMTLRTIILTVTSYLKRCIYFLRYIVNAVFASTVMRFIHFLVEKVVEYELIYSDYII